MNSLINKEELIGTWWECPACHARIRISKDGIEHIHSKHWWRLNLNDLFELEEAKENFRRREFEILYSEKDPSRHKIV